MTVDQSLSRSNRAVYGLAWRLDGFEGLPRVQAASKPSDGLRELGRAS